MGFLMYNHIIVVKKESESRSVVSNSLLSHGLQPARLLCPRDFPGKNTGVGCYLLLQGEKVYVTLISLRKAIGMSELKVFFSKASRNLTLCPAFLLPLPFLLPETSTSNIFSTEPKFKLESRHFFSNPYWMNWYHLISIFFSPKMSFPESILLVYLISWH